MFWQLSLLGKDPVDSYRKYIESTSQEEPVDIDAHPNRDWLRAT